MVESRSKRYLERLISLVIVSIMVLVFFDRINELSAIAERESVQQTLSVIRTGIQVYILKEIVTGTSGDLAGHENGNPVVFMTQLPANYAGEFEQEDSAGIAEGKWYYDLTRQELVYRVANKEIFNNRRELRYQLTFAGSGKDNVIDNQDGRFRLRLLPVGAGA